MTDITLPRAEVELALEWIEAQPAPRMLGAASIISILRERLARQEPPQERYQYGTPLLDAMTGKFARQEPTPDEVIASHAKRLALELECLLLDCKDASATSKWWYTAHEALAMYEADIDRLYPQDHVSPLGKD